MKSIVYKYPVYRGGAGIFFGDLKKLTIFQRNIDNIRPNRDILTILRESHPPDAPEAPGKAAKTSRWRNPRRNPRLCRASKFLAGSASKPHSHFWTRPKPAAAKDHLEPSPSNSRQPQEHPLPAHRSPLPSKFQPLNSGPPSTPANRPPHIHFPGPKFHPPATAIFPGPLRPSPSGEPPRQRMKYRTAQ